jgi:general secretion pathway protein D
MRQSIAAFLSFTLCWSAIAGAQQAQQTPPAASPPKQTAAPAPTISTGSLALNNASLTDVIDALCRLLKINYILDPAVKGSVTLNTYGESKPMDARALLDLVLRINGAAMVETGDIYRIVPIGNATRLLKPNQDVNLPEDEQAILHLLFLKYASVAELAKLIEPFVGEGAKIISYAPANLLFLLDSRRNVRRVLEIIGLFDSDTLARQRVRLFEVKHGSPSDIAGELEEILKSISLTEKNQVRFLPVDRINTIIGIAPSPAAFDEVEKWLQKLDTEAKVTAGAVDNYVYRVKYGRAEILAMVIMGLYGFGGGFGGMGFGGMGFGGMGFGGMGFGGGGFGGGGFGGGGFGGFPGGFGGFPGGYGGGFGGFPGGNIGYGGAGQLGNYLPQYGYGFPGAGQGPLFGTGAAPPAGTSTSGAGRTGTKDQTGQYLTGGYGQFPRIPHIIPNPIDNTLLIQSTPQEYQQIVKLLREVDIPPRQVLIDAKIYEVSMTGAFASGVSAALRQKSGTGGDRQLLGAFSSAGVALSAGALVGASRDLLGFLSLAETEGHAKVVSSPSVIATDSIGASVNVGTEVPTLTAQAVTGVQSGGNSLFANSIQSRNSGVTLNITARVNPSGVVTLYINQEVSAPIPPAPGSIQSPSFSKRNVSTQVTVQDGDTIAIAGIINESNSMSTAGIPVLHRIPIVGSVFGSRSYTRERTELVIFMTPRVIYDTNQMVDATEELKSRLKRVTKYINE